MVLIPHPTPLDIKLFYLTSPLSQEGGPRNLLFVVVAIEATTKFILCTAICTTQSTLLHGLALDCTTALTARVVVALLTRSCRERAESPTTEL